MSAPELPRRIGLTGATVLSFNGAVAASIFALPAALAADFGAFSPLMFPIVALAALLIIIPFTLSASSFPSSGGPAVYGAVFGRLAGFELGWVYYIARAAAFAANANVLAAYTARWVAGADEGVARAALLIGVTTVFAAVNIAGVRKSIGLLSGLTLLKALPLFGAAVAAIALTFPWPPPQPLPTLTEFEAGLLIVLYAFVGFEQAVVPAGETRDPARVLPKAIFATIAVTTLLYFLVQLAFVSAMPGGGGGDDSAPLINLGSWLAGPAGAAILTLTALASLAGSLHGIMTSTPRVSYALAVRRDLPAWFGRVQPRFETPANSILFFAVFACALAISGSFVWLAVVSTLARMIVYAVTIAAWPRAPGPRLSAVHWLLGGAGIVVCAWAASQADIKAWATLGALSLAGLLLYAFAARGSASASDDDDVSAIQPPPSSRDPS